MKGGRYKGGGRDEGRRRRKEETKVKRWKEEIQRM